MLIKGLIALGLQLVVFMQRQKQMHNKTHSGDKKLIEAEIRLSTPCNRVTKKPDKLLILNFCVIAGSIKSVRSRTHNPCGRNIIPIITIDNNIIGLRKRPRV